MTDSASTSVPFAAPCRLCEECWDSMSTIDAMAAITSSEGLLLEKHPAVVNSEAAQACPLCSNLGAHISNVASLGEKETRSPDTGTYLYRLRALGRTGTQHHDAHFPLDFQLITMCVKVWNGRGDESWGYFYSLSVASSAENPAAAFISTRPQIYDVASREAFIQAQQWMQQCARHDDCDMPQPSRLPTRVIAVGCPSLLQPPRLFTPEGDDTRKGYYLALSYCWGREQIVTTTLGSLHAFHDTLPVEQLPQTIRDAIHVTQRLGFKYLWIDALCIIQDSPQDVESEIQRMGVIYSQAVLTIVAASAAEANEGFLQDRVVAHENTIPPFRMPYRCPNGDLGELRITSARNWTPSVDPVNQRGWTLQERLLSPRLLIYSKQQLVWQCRSQEVSYGGTLQIEDIGVDPAGWRLSKAIWEEQVDEPDPTTRQKATKRILREWQTVVVDYSSRSLSKMTDKLAAMVGIAARFHSVLQGHIYASGLWYSSTTSRLFMKSLCWRRQAGRWNGDAPAARPFQLQFAPTWSWSSLNSAVEWSHKRVANDYPNCKVLAVETEPDLISPYVCNEGGIIRLFGAMKVMSLKQLSPKWHVLTSPDVAVPKHYALQVILDCEMADVSDADISISCLWMENYACLILLKDYQSERYRRIGLLSFRPRYFNHHITWEDYTRQFNEYFMGCSMKCIILI